jgi:hypothetical protein
VYLGFARFQNRSEKRTFKLLLVIGFATLQHTQLFCKQRNENESALPLANLTTLPLPQFMFRHHAQARW